MNETEFKFQFAVVAIDESGYWNRLPEGVKRQFGIYLMMVGEATFCCEGAPFTRLEYLYAEYDADVYFSEEAREQADSDCQDCACNIYVPYIDLDRPHNNVSEPFEVTVEAETRELAARVAWEEAFEYANANHREVIPNE